MAGVRALAERVRSLEQARVSPWLRLIGPFEDFEAEVLAGITEHRYDQRDMPLVLMAVQRWVRDGAQ